MDTAGIIVRGLAVGTAPGTDRSALLVRRESESTTTKTGRHLRASRQLSGAVWSENLELLAALAWYSSLSLHPFGAALNG